MRTKERGNRLTYIVWYTATAVLAASFMPRIAAAVEVAAGDWKLTAKGRRGSGCGGAWCGVNLMSAPPHASRSTLTASGGSFCGRNTPSCGVTRRLLGSSSKGNSI